MSTPQWTFVGFIFNWIDPINIEKCKIINYDFTLKIPNSDVFSIIVHHKNYWLLYKI